MKRGFALILVCLLFASVLSVSLISASILGSGFEKSPNPEDANIENSNSNSITGFWSWSRPRHAYCGDGKINVAGEQCDRTNLGGKTCQTQGFSGGTLSCDLNNCRLVTSGCTANSATVQKTCEQTRTLTRRTIGENLCSSNETKITLRSSYRSCSGAFYRRICRNYYDYSCTKTTTTECSLTAVCPTGTREKSSTGCNLPSGVISSNVYIIEDDGTLANLQAPGIMKKFYEQHPDNYDFFSIHYKNQSLFFPTNFLTVQYPAQQGDFRFEEFSSITETDPIEFRRQWAETSLGFFGSQGRLLGGSIDFSNFQDGYVEKNMALADPIQLIQDLYFRILFHEITHLWGATLPSALDEATNDQSGASSIGHFVPHSRSWFSVDAAPLAGLSEKDGKYWYTRDCTSEPKHHDFDLYAMGLISPEEVKDKLVVYEISKMHPYTPCGTVQVPEDWVRRVFTIQDFINVLGPRVPSVVESQKNFNIAFIILVPKGETLTEKERDALHWIANKFPVAWYKSTKGRSTINGIVPQDITPPVISNVQTATTDTSITVSWNTNEPTVGYIIYFTESIANLIYPGIIKNPPVFFTTHNIQIEGGPLAIINQNTEYSIKIISIDENYNMASYDIGIVRTNP